MASIFGVADCGMKTIVRYGENPCRDVKFYVSTSKFIPPFSNARFSNKWATIFAILIPFLLFIGTVLFGDIDTQGTQRYVTDAAQRGDVRSTREQILIRGGSLNQLKALIYVGTNVNVRDPQGRSALYWAGWAGGEPERIKLLL
ncbi:ankyrin repeat domain-containing protein, partial [Nostoc sp. CHAB 5834]|nr:ankyrin repeat domain-containing protein [Nostoc sp. CHAB 5834]